jgi:hypothetical protein
MDGWCVGLWRLQIRVYSLLDQPEALRGDFEQDTSSLQRRLFGHSHASIKESKKVFGAHDVTRVIFYGLKKH